MFSVPGMESDVYVKCSCWLVFTISWLVFTISWLVFTIRNFTQQFIITFFYILTYF